MPNLKKESQNNAELFLAIKKIISDLGYECVNIALIAEDGRQILRIMIDLLGGINLGDCETVSKSINYYLDSPDFNSELSGYYLEVSSPGLERPLFTPADYERFNGKETRIKTNKLIEGRKIHTGFILASNDTSVTLDTEQGVRNLPFLCIVRANLVFKGLESQPAKNKKNINKDTNKNKFRKAGTL